MKTSFYSSTIFALLVTFFSCSFASAQSKYASNATLTAPVNYNAIASFLADNTANRSAATANTSMRSDSGVVVSPTFGAISGPSVVCDDDQVEVTYSVAAITSADGSPVQYYWFVPADWTITAGQGTNSITVLPGNSSGQVAVFAIGYCICSYSCMPVTNECDGDGPITPLPVELISFEAARSQAAVLLSWSTAQERENERFDIERSTNGRDFSRIASVRGNGTTQSRSDYRFTDNQASASVTYYRLKQVDYNGKFEYSSVKAVRAAQISSEPVSAYPNPTSDVVNVQLPTDLSSDAVITISSITGQTLFSASASQMSSKKSIDMSRYNSGVYILSVKNGQENQSLRITKL